MTTYYSVLYTAGENYGKDESLQKKILHEHVMYMQQLPLNTKVILTGPFINAAGGQLVLDVDSEDEAVEIVNNDPAVRLHIFSYRIFPWQIRFNGLKR